MGRTGSDQPEKSPKKRFAIVTEIAALAGALVAIGTAAIWFREHLSLVVCIAGALVLLVWLLAAAGSFRAARGERKCKPICWVVRSGVIVVPLLIAVIFAIEESRTYVIRGLSGFDPLGATAADLPSEFFPSYELELAEAVRTADLQSIGYSLCCIDHLTYEDIVDPFFYDNQLSVIFAYVVTNKDAIIRSIRLVANEDAEAFDALLVADAEVAWNALAGPVWSGRRVYGTRLPDVSGEQDYARPISESGEILGFHEVTAGDPTEIVLLIAPDRPGFFDIQGFEVAFSAGSEEEVLIVDVPESGQWASSLLLVAPAGWQPPESEATP